MPAPRFVIVCNSSGKRWNLYRRELLAFWHTRGVEPDVTVVPWADVVPRDGVLDDLPAFDSPAIVRLESPGKDDVTRLLLEAGARDDPAEPRTVWRDLEIPKGLLVRPGLVYRGFHRVLRGLKASFDARPHLSPTACPLAIAEMFDKTATCRKLAAAGVPVPEVWADPWKLGEPIDLELFNPNGRGNFTRLLGASSVYAKLNTGSSATGIVNLRVNGHRLDGITTLADINGQFFNTRRLRKINSFILERACNFLLAEGAIVQRGIPMAQIDGQNFDVRVVCVNAKPVATIFRLSPHPMTNLHLGGRRGEWSHCRSTIPTRQWLDGLDAASDAAACFDSTIAGVDLLFERGSYRPYILEVNAFGDFFPGWTDSAGRSIHSFEFEALEQLQK